MEFISGDIHYDIPYMLPLRVNKLIIRNDSQLYFVLRNADVYGLENTRIRDVK